VRLLCVDAPGKFPVVGIMERDIHCWMPDGTFFSSTRKDDLDLIEAPETIEIDVWVNVYGIDFVSDAYLTKDAADADLHKVLKRHACINIKRTVTVGEGL